MGHSKAHAPTVLESRCSASQPPLAVIKFLMHMWTNHGAWFVRDAKRIHMTPGSSFGAWGLTVLPHLGWAGRTFGRLVSSLAAIVSPRAPLGPPAFWRSLVLGHPGALHGALLVQRQELPVPSSMTDGSRCFHAQQALTSSDLEPFAQSLSDAWLCGLETLRAEGWWGSSRSWAESGTAAAAAAAAAVRSSSYFLVLVWGHAWNGLAP
jgi:hypothetical protein